MKKISLNLSGTGEDISFDNSQSGSTKSTETPKVVIEQPSELISPQSGMEMQNVSIPKDVYEALLVVAKSQMKKKEEPQQSNNQEIQSALADAISKLADASESKERRFLGARPVEYFEIDSEDLLPSPEIFFTTSVSYAIYDDKRNGHTIKTPYGRPFKFKVAYRVVEKGITRDPKYTTLSSLIVLSKKESEWLKNHTKFGFSFYLQRNGGSDTSTELQELRGKAYQMVSSMNDHQVMQRATLEGLSMTSMDIDKLRRDLSMKIASNMQKEIDKIRSKPMESLDDFSKIRGGATT